MQSCPVHMHGMPWTAAQQQHLDDDDAPVGACPALPVSVTVTATFSPVVMFLPSKLQKL